MDREQRLRTITVTLARLPTPLLAAVGVLVEEVQKFMPTSSSPEQDRPRSAGEVEEDPEVWGSS